ncbi:MAG: hypothetical protein R3E34_02230 [Rhodocyclaceae bacterium]
MEFNYNLLAGAASGGFCIALLGATGQGASSVYACIVRQPAMSRPQEASMPHTAALTITNPVLCGVTRDSDAWGDGRFRRVPGIAGTTASISLPGSGRMCCRRSTNASSAWPYPYANDTVLSVMIEGLRRHGGLEIKIFYMTPADGMVGQSVTAGQTIGSAQSLLAKYPGITNHIHLEIRQNGIVVDPQSLIPNLH